MTRPTPPGPARDWERVLADVGDALRTGRRPEDVQAERHAQERARLRPPRRSRFRRGVYRSRNSHTWPGTLATAAASVAITVLIVAAALAGADWYAEVTK